MVQRQDRYRIPLLSYAVKNMVPGAVHSLRTVAGVFHKGIGIGALETGTPYARCYRLVRTVMEKLKSLPEVKLGGTPESDEFYIKAGLKGRP